MIRAVLTNWNEETAVKKLASAFDRSWKISVVGS